MTGGIARFAQKPPSLSAGTENHPPSALAEDFTSSSFGGSNDDYTNTMNDFGDWNSSHYTDQNNNEDDFDSFVEPSHDTFSNGFDDDTVDADFTPHDDDNKVGLYIQKYQDYRW
jgi:hypothetical protein